MDVFATDLWEVFKERAPADYCDSDAFFNRTYLTQGLKDLLNVVEKRVTGKACMRNATAVNPCRSSESWKIGSHPSLRSVRGVFSWIQNCESARVT